MEKDEFEILAKRGRGKLLALARDFALPSGIEADDVVQEALVSLWELASNRPYRKQGNRCWTY